MVNQRIIGIILPKKTYRNIPKADSKLNTVLSFYEEAARKNGVSLCFLQFSDIQLNQNEITAYVKKEKGYKLTKVPLPYVIYKRSGHPKKLNNLLQSLLDDDRKVFNVYSENQKYNIWKIVDKNNTLAKHQPYTEIASKETIQEMMNKYNNLILKPNIGEIGKGIMRMTKLKDGRWYLYYKRKKVKSNRWKRIYFKDKLPSLLMKKIRKKKYLVQEKINLASYQGNPFDMRVSTQKNHLEEWQVSAIMSKIAKNGEFLTNVGQGGKTYTLGELLKDHPTLNLNQVKKDICDLCIKLAEHISLFKPNMADFGFDIGLSKEGFPYLIEVNHVSDYGSLTLRVGELIADEWKDVYSTPINYACSLLRK